MTQSADAEYIENIKTAGGYIFEGLETDGYCFKVVDGDTIKCLIKVISPIISNKIETKYLKVIVRLDGVDTAEKKSLIEKERKLAEKATAFTKKLLENRRVKLKFLKIDKYGRHLCNVYQYADSNSISGGCVSQQLIENNLANSYTGKKKDSFDDLI